MKILFLDIDGVLNNDETQERFRRYCGLDSKLLSLFLEWYTKHPEVQIVLSSSWRHSDAHCSYLKNSGISFIDTTGRANHMRGDDIRGWLYKKDVSHYAILDDTDEFPYPDQHNHLVLTDYRIGLTPDNLKRVSEILDVQ